MAGRPPRDADMNGMRCYYRNVPTDNSLRPGERRGAQIRKRGAFFDAREAKGRNSRRIAFENRMNVHGERVESNADLPRVSFDLRAFFYQSSLAP